MIEQNVARVVYKGDGRTQEFPFSFPVLDRKFIYVIISDRNGREKTLKSDYYVDMDKHVVLYPGYPKGEEPAEAERPAVLAPGEKIVIYRNTPVSQLTSLGDKWPFDVCEKALDKLTMIDQENKESISRTVRLAGATEEVEVVLPPPEKDTAIGWSEDGKSVINVPVKRWQEEARAAAAEAQTQASMAMTYKEESKEARSKAEQSEEKAREYADRAVMAETKVRGYATVAEEKHNAFVKSAETAKNEINALSEEVKAGITLTGGEQQNLIKGNATDAIESVRKQGIDETERVKAQGKTLIQDVQKAQGGAETAAREARTAADEAKEALKTAMGGVDLTEYAKKESLVGLASTEYVDGRFTHLIGASAEALDTLEEIGKSLKNDADFAGTMTKELAKKADRGTVENALIGKAAKANVYTKQKVNDLMYLLQRNKYYRVGDIVNSTNLPSYLYLECVQAGTTGSTEPKLSTGGVVVNDGSCKFRVMDRRMKAMIDVLYPVGIVITTATDNTPKPGEEYGLAQWEEIGRDRVLQGCSTGAGNTIEAGLPNITGEFYLRPLSDGNGISWNDRHGAIESKIVANPNDSSASIANGTEYRPMGGLFFDASKSNGIYGKSNTVQPSALKVHFWKRIK